MQEATLTICNEKGLHARAASCFAKTAAKYDCKIIVTSNGMQANATSIMGLMMLIASKDCIIHLQAEGREEEKAIKALSALVTAGFHE